MQRVQTELDLTLRDREIAITGRLASMTRDEAVQRICAAGGRFAMSPSTRTDLLVVGQEGWPLNPDGGLSQGLRRARDLQEDGSALRVISEGEFLVALGLEDRREDIHRLYTTAQLSRILGVPAREITSWVRKDLIRPVRIVHRLCYFDFQQVASCKILQQLLADGATPTQIRRSLAQLRTWLPGTETPLSQLEALEGGGPLVVRLEDGQVAEPSGQLRLDFDATQSSGRRRELFEVDRTDAAEWFARGIEAEEAGDLEAAADNYHQSMLAGGPSAETAFNLGNVLYSLDRRGEAVQRFMQAVEIEPDYVEAWNNLGNTLAELDRHAQAVTAYERALRAAPHYSDAHYNLADTLEQMGRVEDARQHWLAYLAHDPNGLDAAQVRDRLRELDSNVEHR